MKQFNLEEYLNNTSRKVVTRDGRNVNIHCTNYSAHYPIIAEIQGVGYSDSFYPDGRYSINAESRNDLFFAPEKKEGWVNIFKGAFINAKAFLGQSYIYSSEEIAKSEGKKYNNYLSTVKIEWEE